MYGVWRPLTGQHRWTLDETASRDIIRYGLEKGINFYTAIAYQNGSSERYVGRALREMAKRETWCWPPSFCHELPRKCRGDRRKRGNSPIARPEPAESGDGLHRPLHLPHLGLQHAPLSRCLKRFMPPLRAKCALIGINAAAGWRKRTPLPNAKGLTPFVSVQSHYNLIMRERALRSVR